MKKVIGIFPLLLLIGIGVLTSLTYGVEKQQVHVESGKGTVVQSTGTTSQSTGIATEIVEEDTFNINDYIATLPKNKKAAEAKKTYNGVTARVQVAPGSFPLGTIIRIVPITKQIELDTIKQQIIEQKPAVEETSEIVAFDITFIYTYSGEEIEIQPLDEQVVKVLFNYAGNELLSEADEEDNKEVKIFHIDDKDEEGNKVEKGEEVVKEVAIKKEESSEGEVVIDADSFSVYTIVVQRAEENPTGTRKYGKDYGIVSIAKPSSITESGLPEGIIIMDRNLGATSNDITSTGSYGYKYQWGNNYGFSDSLTLTPVTPGLTWSDSYNNSGYLSKSFIKGIYNDDVWSNKSHHDGIWGGEDDYLSNGATNGWGAKSKNYTDRQGPCPEGWHVPSIGEWGLLIKYWRDTYATGITLDGSNNLYGFNNRTGAQNFMNYFKLPFVGYRSYTTANIEEQGSRGNYRSSSPCGYISQRNAYFFFLNSNSVDYGFGSRAYGYSVRCFKDSLVVPKTYTLTFNSKGGSEVATGIAVENDTWSRPDDPIKDDSVFVDWFLSGSNTAFDFTTIATGNLEVYAKWNCKTGYPECVQAYTVTYNATTNGGIVENNSEEVEGGNTLILGNTYNPAIKTGWTFLGWNTSSTAHEGLESINVTGDITLYAIFYKQLGGVFSGNGAFLRTGENIVGEIINSCMIYKESQDCTITVPEIVRSEEDAFTIGYSTGADDREIVLDKTIRNLTLTEENSGTIYYAISYKTLYTTFKGNGNKQIQNGTTEEKVTDIIEDCRLWNTATTCSIITPDIVGSKNGDVWYASSNEKTNKELNKKRENTEIDVTEESPKTYFAWSVSDPETYTVSYSIGTGILNMGEIAAGSEGCQPELSYNDEELITTCRIGVLPTLTEKVGYHTPKWYIEGDEEAYAPGVAYGEEICGNMRFIGRAIANTDTVYHVKHYFQMLEGEGVGHSYKLEHTDVKSGTTDSTLILSELQVSPEKQKGFRYRLAKINGNFTSNIVSDETLEELVSQNLDAYEGGKVLEIQLFYDRLAYSYEMIGGEGMVTTGGSTENGTYYYEQEIILSGGVENDCYVWRGWNMSGTGEVEVVEVDRSYEMGDVRRIKMPARSLVVEPEIKEKVYSISFNKNGGNVEGEMEVIPLVRCTETITLPENRYTREQYIFDGWSKTSGGEVEYEDKETITNSITKGNNTNVVLYAQRHLIPYEINYILDGGVAEGNPETYNIESEFILNRPEKTGHTFLGWTGGALDENLRNEDNWTEEPKLDIMITRGSTGDREYTAQYQINQYLLTLHTNGCTPIDPIVEDVYYDDEIEEPEVEKEGYTTKGWEPTLPKRMMAKAFTSRVVMQAHEYKVVFHANNLSEEEIELGIEEETREQNFVYDEAQTLAENEFVRLGYIYRGWNEDSEATEVEYEDEQEVLNLTSEEGGVIDLYAVWEPRTDTKFNVKLYLEKVEGGYPAEENFTGESKGTTDTMTNYKAPGIPGFEVETINNTKIKGDGSAVVTVYYKRKSYEVRYQTNSGELLEGDNVRQIRFEATIPLPGVIRTGYQFRGWTGVPTDGLMPFYSVVLNAQWEAERYIVSFDTQVEGLNAVPSQKEVVYDSTYGVLPEMEREGYIFDGWYTEPEGGTRVESGTIVTTTGNHTLYAYWQEKTEKIYKVNHMLENANDTGYILDHYEEKEGLIGNQTEAEARFYTGFKVEPFEQKIINRIGETVVEIKYSRNYYAVTFNSKGGTAVETITGKYEQTLTQVDSPTKTGYVFSGWNPKFPEIMPLGGIRLEAEWKADTGTHYIVEHYLKSLEGVYILDYTENGVGETEQQTAAQGRPYAGFTVNRIENTTILADGSAVAKVYYDRNNYTVYFNTQAEGVNAVPSEEQVIYGGNYGELPVVERVGYTFNGWYTGTEGGDKIESGTTVSITNNQTLYAQWIANNYTVYFNTQVEGLDAVPSQKEVTYEGSYGALPVVGRQGYVFSGWYTQAEGGTRVENGTIVKITNNQTLYAQWKPGNSLYHVNHYLKNLDGATYTLKDTETLEGKTESQTAAQQKTYEGFSLENEVTQEPILADQSTQINIYYKRNNYRIEVIAGTGVEEVSGGGIFTYGSSIEVWAKTKEGYLFSGGVREKTFDVEVPSRDSNVIIHATANKYVVKYTTLEGEGEMEDQEFTYDITGTLHDNQFINSGYQLKGWKTEEGTEYKPRAEVINLATGGIVTLIAQWEVPHKVKYMDGGTLLFEEEYISGDKITPGRQPSKNGYIFEGWSGMPANNIMGQEDIVVNAVWRQGTVVSKAGGGSPLASQPEPAKTEEKKVENKEETKKEETKKEEVNEEEQEHKSAETSGNQGKAGRSGLAVSEEVETAYEWAYKNKITTLSPIERANPEQYVYRGHMAKMVVNYVTNVLGRELPKETPKECQWKDNAKKRESEEIKDYARKACAFGIMGIDTNYFEPTRYVSRAQFGTILSRILWGTKYNVKHTKSTPYYKKHLQALKEHLIMTQIDNPEKRIEQREWVWLMLMRTEDSILEN